MDIKIDNSVINKKTPTHFILDIALKYLSNE